MTAVKVSESMNSSWCLPAVLLLAASLAPCQITDGERSFVKALELHRAGDFEGAIREYQNCLQAEPDKIEARSNLGAALARVGRYGEATEQYRLALQRATPQSAVPLRMNLALALYKTGDIPKAVEELEAVRAVDSSHLQVTLLLADCRLRMGEFPKVIDLLQPLQAEMGAGSPNSLAIRYMLGTSLIRSGQIPEGQAVVDVILRNSESAEAKLLVGMSMFAAADYPGAVSQLGKVIEINPNLPSVYSFYGQALLYTGDADGALAAFRKALEQDPYDFDSNLRLGQILEARQQYQESLPLLERALMTRPAAREVHGDLATVYAKVGREADAARERALAGPKQPPAAATGPQPGQIAPDFTLSDVNSGRPVALKQLRQSKPVVIVFGSYTCPKLRSSASALQEMHTRFRDQVRFVFVYIHEAHTDANWQSTINEREGVQLKEARTIGEKREHAILCRRRLKFDFPTAADGLDNRIESLYAAWPSRAYLVGVDGVVLWNSPLGELDFKPDELEAAITAAVGAKPQRPPTGSNKTRQVH